MVNAVHDRKKKCDVLRLQPLHLLEVTKTKNLSLPIVTWIPKATF